MTRIIFTICFVLWLTTSALADVVELTTGQRVEGTLKQVTGASVVIEVGGQTITFQRQQVRAIHFGAAPTPRGPGLVTEQHAAAREALQDLKDLRSFVGVGANLSFSEYTTRVRETKVKVNRYFDKAPKEEVTRKTLKETMDYYELASIAWDVKNRGFDYDLLTEPAFLRCKYVKKFADSAESSLPLGQKVAFGYSFFWYCASDKIAEAERLLGGRK